MKQTCPKCESRDTRESNSQGSFDWFFAMLARSPFRCRKCGRRFYAKSGVEPSADEARRTTGKRPDGA